MTENQSREEIFRFLKEKGIPHRYFFHPVANTLEEKLQNDENAGIRNATHCKNLVLANRQKTKFYFLTIPFTKRFQTGPTSRQMGSGRLNFAEDEILHRVLKTVPGMVSPLELIFDENKILSYFMDEDLKTAERICFHPSDDTCTVIFEREDFFQVLLPAMGVTVKFVTLFHGQNKGE